MTLRSSDLQSDSDLDSIRNSCDVFKQKSCEVIIGLLHNVSRLRTVFRIQGQNKSNSQHLSYQESQQDQNTFVSGFFDIINIKHSE